MKSLSSSFLIIVFSLNLASVQSFAKPTTSSERMEEQLLPRGFTFSDVLNFVLMGDPALVSTLVTTSVVAATAGYWFAQRTAHRSTGQIVSSTPATGTYADGYAAHQEELYSLMLNFAVEGQKFGQAITAGSRQNFVSASLHEKLVAFAAFIIAKAARRI